MRAFSVYIASIVAGGSVAAVSFSLLAIALHDCEWRLCRMVDSSLVDGSAHIARLIVGNGDSVIGMVFWTMIGVPFVIGSVLLVGMTFLGRRMTN